jgi:hypothetical protein
MCTLKLKYPFSLRFVLARLGWDFEAMPLSPNYAPIWKVLGCVLLYESHYRGKLLRSEDAHAICNAVSPQPISLDLFEKAIASRGDDTFKTPISGFGEAVVAKNNLFDGEVFYVRKIRQYNKRCILLGSFCSSKDVDSAEDYIGNLSSARHVKGVVIQQCIPCILLETLDSFMGG